MDLMLKDKSVFVAAASKGLGKASALAFAREGARVTIASRNVEQLQQAQADIAAATGRSVTIVQMDATRAEDIRRAVRTAAEAGGGLDVVVTNAGGPMGGRFDDFTDADWEEGYNLVLMSTIRMIREALPFLRAAGEGRIVNIASSSVKQPIPGILLSNVFRAGVQALTKSLASELADDRILINTIAPGRIATDRLIQLDRKKAEEQGRALGDIQEESIKDIPLGRLGSPEEFGALVAFYGSFANTYVTGQTVLVDGGLVKAL